MSYELVLGLMAFAFVSSITPGPNNLMLMTSGVNFGLMRTLPHLFGVVIGVLVLFLALGAGLNSLLLRYPQAYLVLKILSAAYMLWLAYKIFNAAPPIGKQEGAKPLGFAQALAFQWVNPKAWAMVTTSLTIYAPTGTIGAVFTVSLIFACINMPSVSMWVLLGQKFRLLLSNARTLRIFNGVMAGLLVVSLLPILFL